MNEKTISISHTIMPIKNDEKELAFDLVREGLRTEVFKYCIQKNELIEDYIYKNLETSILQAMKLKIENELMNRLLQENNNEQD